MIPKHIRREIERAADGARHEAVVRFDNHGPHDQMGATLWNLSTHLREQVLDRDERESTAAFEAVVERYDRAIRGPGLLGVWFDEHGELTRSEVFQSSVGREGRFVFDELNTRTDSPEKAEQWREYWDKGHGSKMNPDWKVQTAPEYPIGNEIHKLVEKLRDRVEEQMAAQLAALPEDQRAWLGQKWIEGEIELSVVNEEPEMHASGSYTVRAEIRPRLRRHKIDVAQSELYGRHRVEDVGLDIFAAAFTEPEMTVVGEPVVAAPRPECGCPRNAAGDISCHVCGEKVNVKCWRCGTPRGNGRCSNPVVPDPPFDHELAAWNCVKRAPMADYNLGQWCLACSGGKPNPGQFTSLY